MSKYLGAGPNDFLETGRWPVHLQGCREQDAAGACWLNRGAHSQRRIPRSAGKNLDFIELCYLQFSYFKKPS